MKIFKANSVFQGKRKLFNILNDKKNIYNTVNSGHTLFFRASKSCSNTLNLKSILNTLQCKNFMTNSVFRASASSSKILKDKKYFNAVKNFRVNSIFQGKRKLFKILND